MSSRRQQHQVMMEIYHFKRPIKISLIAISTIPYVVKGFKIAWDGWEQK